MSNKFLKNIYNSIDFFFRKNIRFSRSYNGKNESKDSLFSNLPADKAVFAQEKEQEYLTKYSLQRLKEYSTNRLYLENLAIIELLETYFSNEINKYELKVLDIGSKNWFYAYGEYSFFKYSSFEKTIYLDGVEIDSFRLYSDFHSRYDYARYYIRELENTSYISGSLIDVNKKYNFITWFFPFVTSLPLLEWGLPLSEFIPEKLLRKAYSLLESGGHILLVNQDEVEYNVQHKLLNDLGISFIAKGKFESSFIEYEHKRFVTLIRK